MMEHRIRALLEQVQFVQDERVGVLFVGADGPAEVHGKLGKEEDAHPYGQEYIQQDIDSSYFTVRIS